MVGGPSAAGGGAPLTGGAYTLAQTVGLVTAGAASAGSLALTGGLFGLSPSAAATLERLHAFPVPFRPSLGHDRITFRGTTTRTTIRVFTLSGWLVKTLTKNDATTADLLWRPVANSAGQPLASGVYPYYAESDDGGRRWGKLMVIK